MQVYQCLNLIVHLYHLNLGVEMISLYRCIYNFTPIYCSCTGHYIPQLAQLMVEFNKKEKHFNLKGIAVSKIISILCKSKENPDPHFVILFLLLTWFLIDYSWEIHYWIYLQTSIQGPHSFGHMV